LSVSKIRQRRLGLTPCAHTAYRSGIVNAALPVRPLCRTSCPSTSHFHSETRPTNSVDHEDEWRPHLSSMTTDDVEGHQAWPRAMYLCREGRCRCQFEPPVDAFETESARQRGTLRGRSFGDGIVLWGHGLAAACERTIQKERSRPRWVRLAQSRKRAGMPAFCRGPPLTL